MKLLYLITFLVLLNSPARPEDSTKIFDNFVYDFKTGVVHSIGFFTAPLYFTADDWTIASGVLAGTMLMFAFDEELETNEPTIFSKNKNFQKGLGYYGDVDYANILSIGLYAAGLFTGMDEVRTTGRLLVESLFLSGSTALLLRLVTGRPRPYMNEGSTPQWFETDLDYQSFPSGHTTVVFAVSTILAERADVDILRVGLYGLASVAAIERIYSNEHWFSDVIVGGLLGFGSAMFVLNQEEKDKSTTKGGLSIFPTSRGINLIWSF